MAKNNECRETLTVERDEALYQEYQNVIKSHGKDAPFMAKKELYRQASVKFFITPDSARNIIQRLLRKRTVTSDRK